MAYISKTGLTICFKNLYKLYIVFLFFFQNVLFQYKQEHLQNIYWHKSQFIFRLLSKYDQQIYLEVNSVTTDNRFLQVIRLPKVNSWICALRFLHMGYHIDTEVQISQLLQQLTLMVYYFTIMLYGPRLPLDYPWMSLTRQNITFVCSALFVYKPPCYQDL